MGNNDLTPIAILPPALLQRRAIVYVRQSTQSQVMTNLESQRRQYDLVSSARQYGFQTVDGPVGRFVRRTTLARNFT